MSFSLPQSRFAMTLLWILLALAVVAAGWFWFEGTWDRRLFTAGPGRVCCNLSAAEANAWLEQHPETQVLDVRSAREFAGGALPGAVNLSIGEDDFETKVSVLDRNRPVLVYCAGGYRSRRAVEKLKQLDFIHIRHLHRGYMSWKPEDRP